jgi:quercetin dioxygenase-like cupin family protein
MRSARRNIGWVLAIGMLAAAATGPLTAGNATSAGPVTVSQAAFPVTAADKPYDLINLVLDFAPGTGIPKHIHGGPVVATVLTGQLVLQQAGQEQVVKAGESFREQTGTVHAVVNRGALTTRVAVSILLPLGAEATTLVK